MSNLGNQQLGDIILGLGEEDEGSENFGFGQAQALIKQTYQGYGQCQARILQIYYGLAQAQATLATTSQGYGQAEAKINAFGVNGFGQAQAKLNAFDVNAFGQAQATLANKVSVHGQAQASIRTIIFDAATESVRTGTETTYDFTHTPVGTPRAIVVTSAAPAGTFLITGMTYGGVPMARATRDADTSSEIGTTEIWFLGTGIPAGPQTVSVSIPSATTADYHFVAMSFLGTSSSDMEIVFGGSVAGDRVDPYLVVSNFGRISQGVLVTWSGQDAPASITVQSGNTLVHDHDFGANSSKVARQNVPTSQDVSLGFTIALEDNSFSVLTFSEAIPHPQVYSQAQAVIASTKRTGQARAFILVATNRIGQANALIDSGFGVNAYGQAAALLARFNGYGNAQGTILAVSNGYGQALAQIAGLQHGQAQAAITNAQSLYYNTVMGSDPAAYYRFTETIAAGDTGEIVFDTAGSYHLTKPNASRGPISATSNGIANTTETQSINSKNGDTTPYNGHYLWRGADGTGTSPINSVFNWALEIWIKPTQITTGITTTRVISVGADGLNPGFLSINISGADARASATWGTAPGTGSTISGSGLGPVLSTTEFYHVVFTRGTGFVKLYVNGVLVDANPAATFLTDPGNGIYINYNTSANQVNRFILDETALYTRELLPEEILEHFRVGSGRNVWYGQAQALIRRPEGYGQANAKILAFNVNKHAQAQARIRRNEGYGQALARIMLDTNNSTNDYQDVVLADDPISYWTLNDELPPDIPSYSTFPSYSNVVQDLISGYDLVRPFSGANRGPFGGQEGIPATIGTDDSIINRDTLDRGTSLNTLERQAAGIPLVGPSSASNFGIELWFKLKSSTPVSDIQLMLYGNIGEDQQGAVAIYFSTSLKLYGWLRTSVNNLIGLGGPTLNDTEWHQAVITRGNGGNTNLYIDGVLIHSVFINLVDFSQSIRINNNSNDQSQFYLDEIALYDHELTADRVGQHYLVGKKIGQGYGQAAALIDAYRPVGQAQAVIQKDGFGFGQARAWITLLRGFGRAQAQARIKYANLQSYGQAQAEIAEVTTLPVAQAQAIIYGPYIHQDTFTRTTDIGYIGDPDIGGYDLSKSVLLPYLNVDGDKLNFEVTAPAPETGYFYYGSAWTQAVASHSISYIEFTLEDVLQISEGFYAALVTKSNTTGSLSARAYYYFDEFENFLALDFRTPPSSQVVYTFDDPITLTPGATYALKVTVVGQTASAKVWDITDPEPDWQLTEEMPSPLWNSYGTLWMEVQTFTTHEETPVTYPRFDNYNIISLDNVPESMGLALAAARIKVFDTNKFAQAQASIIRFTAWGQAAARIRAENVNRFAQVRAKITYRGYASGQAQALIARFSVGQAQASILTPGMAHAQCLALITRATRTNQHAQARARIKRFKEVSFGQALADIKTRGIAHGQCQALIAGNKQYGQAQAWVAYGNRRGFGQAMASILRTIKQGQAMALIRTTVVIGGNPILLPSPTYLVEYNGYTLPGYAQSEALESLMDMKVHEVAMKDATLTEYMGLQNKLISLEMRVWDQTYIACKEQVQRAGVILRSKKYDYGKLRLQYADKYYEALVKKISTDKVARSSNYIADYSVEFECKPWLFSEEIHEISGTGTISTPTRTISDGGWTPVTLEVSGSNITVSGYTDTENFTGYITIPDTVTNLEIDTENNTYLTSDLFVGPGTTHFTITGASSCTIRYRDRWYL